MKLTEEQMMKAAKCSGFMQNFKMAWWKRRENDVTTMHIPEKTLDELAMIAFDILNEEL